MENEKREEEKKQGESFIGLSTLEEIERKLEKINEEKMKRE